ncbi:MAG: hypothetical protein VW806_05285, partial [Halieaceae bacterium]
MNCTLFAWITPFPTAGWFSPDKHSDPELSGLKALNGGLSLKWESFSFLLRMRIIRITILVP